MREGKASSKRQLYKNPDQAKICGVCAGLADYFDFEVWVVRIISISLLILGGFWLVILAYIVLCFVLDPKPGSRSNKGCFGRNKKPKTPRYAEENDSKPYRSSVKDVWRSGYSPKDTLEKIENKFSRLEKKLQGIESFVTSREYELEKKFKEMES